MIWERPDVFFGAFSNWPDEASWLASPGWSFWDGEDGGWTSVGGSETRKPWEWQILGAV